MYQNVVLLGCSWLNNEDNKYQHLKSLPLLQQHRKLRKFVHFEILKN